MLAINIVTDITFVLIPVPIIRALQIGFKDRLSLMFIVSLGLFACAASAVKLYYQVDALSIVNPLRWNSFNMWNSIEIYTGIIAASLPTLRTLIRRRHGSTRGAASQRTHNRYPPVPDLEQDRITTLESHLLEDKRTQKTEHVGRSLSNPGECETGQSIRIASWI